MEYITYNQLRQGQWNQIVGQLTHCPFNYTEEKIDFDVEYSQKLVENQSFVLREGEKIFAVAAIYIEEGEEGERAISWNGSYCPGIYVNTALTYQQQEHYGKKALEHIDSIADSCQCREIWLRLDPLGNPGQKFTFYNYNFLLKYHYMDRSSLTQIIDLTKSESELYADLCRNHRRNIKKGEKFEIEFYDSSNITREQIEIYKRIYEADAKKVTRNSQLYLHYLRFIQGNKGVLALARHRGTYVAVLIATYFHDTAYYSSYGELEDRLEGIPVGHALHWAMIGHLKKRGIKSYEIGEQVFGKNHYSCPDQKLVDISSFKRGFGGYTVPFFRGKKTNRPLEQGGGEQKFDRAEERVCRHLPKGQSIDDKLTCDDVGFKGSFDFGVILAGR